MQIENFGKRLADLRAKKGVSARDMSLSLGMGPAYINNVENGHNLPSMEVFFYICEYLEISPCDFFNTEIKDPSVASKIADDIKSLTPIQLEIIRLMIEQMR